MRRFFFMTVLLMGCSGGAGLGGCSSGEPRPFDRTSTNLMENSVHGVLTSAGYDFIYANREALVAQIFQVDESGWANFELPPLDGGGDSFTFYTRDLSVGLHLREAEIELELMSNPLRIRMDARNTRLRVNQGIAGVQGVVDGACQMSNGLNETSPLASVANANFSVTLTPRIDLAGRLQATVTMEALELSELNVNLTTDPNLPECQGADSRCDLVCGVGAAGAELTEALYTSFGEELTTVTAPILEEIMNERLAEITNQPLRFEGEVDLSALSEELPLPDDAHPFQLIIRPHGEGLVYVPGDNQTAGIGLSLDIGNDAVPHPCVPRTAGDPVFNVGPQPNLSSLDPNGDPFHFSFSVAEALVNRTLWSAWRSGLFCVSMDTERIRTSLEREVDSSTLSIFLPSLTTLTDDPVPIMVVLNPQFSKATFPIARFGDVADDQGIPQAALSIGLPGVGVDMYAYINDRWTRLTQITTDLYLDLVVQATAENELILAGDQPRIENLSVEYNELLETDDVPALMQAMLDLAIGAFLTDGLDLDFGLTGLLNQFTGLPYDLRITAINTAGAVNDHLAVYLAVDEFSGGMALHAAVDTRAELVGLSQDTVRIKVSAPGAQSPLYQWRFEDGHWRPLGPAEEGYLNLSAARFRLNMVQKIEIRAVDAHRIGGMDMTPALVTVPPPPQREIRSPVPAQPSGFDNQATGCQSHSGSRFGPGLLLSLTMLLAMGGLRRRHRPWLLSLLILTLGMSGCEDRRAASEIPCDQSTVCPRGLICLEGTCQPETPCTNEGNCCLRQTCQGGICRAAPSDGCNESDCGPLQICVDDVCVAPQCDEAMPCEKGRCLQGYCVDGPPCEGGCASHEACFVNHNLCRALEGACALSCPAGETKVVVDPGRFESDLCQPNTAECICADTLGDTLGSISRDAHMTLVDGTPIFASYDPYYGDLVLVTGVAENAPVHLYLDGLPEGADSTPSPSRHGLVDRGPKRGLYPQIASDILGQLHIAYYDASVGSLRYMRRNSNGLWVGPIVVDERGDTGRFVQLRADNVGRPHMVYSFLADPNGTSGLRYALGSADALDASQFEITVVSSADTRTTPPVAVGQPPTEHGVHPCMALNGDSVLVAFYDATDEWLHLAQGGRNGFQVFPLRGEFSDGEPEDPGGRYAGFDSHRIGEHCAIIPKGEGVQVAFTNNRTWSLLGYEGPVEGGGTLELIDEGIWGSRQMVGADVVSAQDHLGRMVVVYQNGTTNDLLLNVHTENGWLTSPLLVDGSGALGFGNSLVIEDGNATIGTIRIRTVAGGRENSQLQVYRIDLRAY